MNRWLTQNGGSVAVRAIGVVVAFGVLGTCFFPSESLAKGKNEKVIDFDDSVVEGMNKKPLDSLSQISERDKKKRRPHLYRKRAGFNSETNKTIRVLRHIQ